MSFELGRAAGVEALANHTPMRPLFAVALAVRTTPPGAQMLGGLLTTMCMALDACQRQNIKFSLSDQAATIANALPKARELLIFALCQRIDQTVAEVLCEIADAVGGVRFNTSVSDPVPEPTPPEPVLRMAIVGLPERTTNTSLTRGSDGVLIGSTSVERDV